MKSRNYPDQDHRILFFSSAIGSKLVIIHRMVGGAGRGRYSHENNARQIAQECVAEVS